MFIVIYFNRANKRKMHSKFHNFTFYPAHSSDRVSRHESKFRYSPQMPALFTHEIIFAHKNEESIVEQKFKSHKELLENARLPSFNIKKLMDKSKKRKQFKFRDNLSNVSLPSGKKSIVNNGELKRYLQNYLKRQFSHQDPQKGREDAVLLKEKRLSQRKRGEREGKQINFINNFIKTNYRKRKIYNKSYVSKQMRPKQERNQNNLKKLQKQTINWMVPWQKQLEHYQQQFFHGE